MAHFIVHVLTIYSNNFADAQRTKHKTQVRSHFIPSGSSDLAGALASRLRVLLLRACGASCFALAGDGKDRSGILLLRVWQTHPQAQRRRTVRCARDGQEKHQDDFPPRGVSFGPPPPAEATQRENSIVEIVHPSRSRGSIATYPCSRGSTAGKHRTSRLRGSVARDDSSVVGAPAAAVRAAPAAAACGDACHFIGDPKPPRVSAPAHLRRPSHDAPTLGRVRSLDCGGA